MESGKISCGIKVGAVIVAEIIILLIIVSIITGISIYLVKRLKKNISKNYRLSTVEYCQNLPPINYTSTITKPMVNGIYEYDLAKAFLETSLLVTQSNCFNIVPISNPPSFTNQYRIFGTDPSNGKRRMFVTVFTNFDAENNVENNTEEKIIKQSYKFLIVFSGTFSLNEWKDDFTYPLVEGNLLNNYETGIQVHKGFYNVYLSIRDKLWNLFEANKDKINEFYITGHSLGGALSTLCAFDFSQYDPIHYSFAAPRSGNINYSNKFNILLPNSLRIYNNEDIIHSVPPSVFFNSYTYQHTGNGIPFDANLGTIANNHITAYENYLPKCIKNRAPCNENNIKIVEKK
mgnify:CR=1 FL=1